MPKAFPSLALKCKVIDIGDWNMDATGVVNITHGLTMAKIRDISVLIRQDDDTWFLPIDIPCDVAGDWRAAGYWYVQSSLITIYRTENGTFDSITYDATGFNRGWVTIWYVP